MVYSLASGQMQLSEYPIVITTTVTNSAAQPSLVVTNSITNIWGDAHTVITWDEARQKPSIKGGQFKLIIPDQTKPRRTLSK